MKRELLVFEFFENSVEVEHTSISHFLDIWSRSGFLQEVTTNVKIWTEREQRQRGVSYIRLGQIVYMDRREHSNPLILITVLVAGSKSKFASHFNGGAAHYNYKAHSIEDGTYNVGEKLSSRKHGQPHQTVTYICSNSRYYTVLHM